MTDQIILDARKHLQETIKDPHYKLSHIWKGDSENQSNLTKLINNVNNPKVLWEELSRTDMYAIRIGDENLFHLMMDWHQKMLRDMGWKELCPITPNLCKMMMYCLRMKENGIELSESTVIELGGGNGQLALMMKHFGMQHYIDIDIPESLYMAYVCNRYNFPNLIHLWINEDTGIYDILNSDFVYCPVYLARKLEETHFYLFVNTASMGEMPNETIRYWMNFVQNKIHVKYFYGLNRFLNTIQAKNKNPYSLFREQENEASVLFDKYWKIMNWEVEPAQCRCPYEDPKIARYLEVIAQRVETPIIRFASIDDIKAEDWWRLKDTDPMGTHRSNQLIHDYTIDGTLFKVWDRIRFSPDKETIDMMLEYMNWICKESLVFEEESYYRKLRETL